MFPDSGPLSIRFPRSRLYGPLGPTSFNFGVARQPVRIPEDAPHHNCGDALNIPSTADLGDLVRQRLDDVQIGQSRDHLIDTETSSTQQMAVFLHCAFLPSGHEHHDYISELAGRGSISFG
jgi:hypothetical protein